MSKTLSLYPWIDPRCPNATGEPIVQTSLAYVRPQICCAKRHENPQRPQGQAGGVKPLITCPHYKHPCSFTTTDPQRMFQHVQRPHFSTMIYVCQADPLNCKFAAKTMPLLNHHFWEAHHIRQAQGDNTVQTSLAYVCTQICCAKRLENPQRPQGQTGGVKPLITCPHDKHPCSFTTTDPQQMFQHVQRPHVSTMIHSCQADPLNCRFAAMTMPLLNQRNWEAHRSGQAQGNNTSTHGGYGLELVGSGSSYHTPIQAGHQALPPPGSESGYHTQAQAGRQALIPPSSGSSYHTPIQAGHQALPPPGSGSSYHTPIQAGHQALPPPGSESSYHTQAQAGHQALIPPGSDSSYHTPAQAGYQALAPPALATHCNGQAQGNNTSTNGGYGMGLVGSGSSHHTPIQAGHQALAPPGSGSSYHMPAQAGHQALTPPAPATATRNSQPGVFLPGSRLRFRGV